MKLTKILNEVLKESKYNLAGDCVTGLDDPYFQRRICSDATEMAGVVDEYSNEFLTKDEFLNKVNWPEEHMGPADENRFDFAYNPQKDIYWAYDIDDDVHYFFVKDKINENYKSWISARVITEIGDSTKGYPYTLDYSKGVIQSPKGDSYAEYSFKDNNDTEYSVEIYNKEGYLDIEFSIPYESPTEIERGRLAVSNLRDQYRVMGTIVDIVKDILKKDKKNQIKGVAYNPMFKNKERSGKLSGDPKDSKEAINQRDKLYRAYIEKLKPGTKFSRKFNTIIADFPKNK